MPDPGGNWTEAHVGPERGLLGGRSGSGSSAGLFVLVLGLDGLLTGGSWFPVTGSRGR